MGEREGWRGIRVFAAEVVRGGSDKLIDGNKMFHRVATQRHTGYMRATRCTHMCTCENNVMEKRDLSLQRMEHKLPRECH